MALTWMRGSDGSVVFRVSKVEEVEPVLLFLLREYGITDLRDFDEHFPDGVSLEGPFDINDFEISKSQGNITHWVHRTATRR